MKYGNVLNNGEKQEVELFKINGLNTTDWEELTDLRTQKDGNVIYTYKYISSANSPTGESAETAIGKLDIGKTTSSLFNSVSLAEIKGVEGFDVENISTYTRTVNVKAYAIQSNSLIGGAYIDNNKWTVAWTKEATPVNIITKADGKVEVEYEDGRKINLLKCVAGSLYGKEVKYVDDESDDTNIYRLFFIDFDNKYGDGKGTIYLKSDYGEKIKLNEQIQGYTDYSNSKIAQMNPLWKNARNNIENDNEKAAAWLCDSTVERWSIFANSKANYVIASPSVEMYIDSYNQAFEYEFLRDNYLYFYKYDEFGYKYSYDRARIDSEKRWIQSFELRYTTKNKEMYTSTEIGIWWLASPGSYGNSKKCVNKIDCLSENYIYLGVNDIYQNLYIRPLVCVKPQISLDF